MSWSIIVHGGARSIAPARDGCIGWAHDGPHHAVASGCSVECPGAYVHKDEESLAT